MDNGADVLRHLYNSRVAWFGLDGSGGIKVEEACDEYFSVTLTPSQVRMMADELVRMADEAEQRKVKV